MALYAPHSRNLSWALKKQALSTISCYHIQSGLQAQYQTWTPTPNRRFSASSFRQTKSLPSSNSSKDQDSKTSSSKPNAKVAEKPNAQQTSFLSEIRLTFEALKYALRSNVPPPSMAGEKTRRRWLGLGPITLTILLVVLSGGGWLGYRFYKLSRVYPEVVRVHLRVGLRGMHDKDWAKAEAGFRRALQVMHMLPPSEFSSDPLLKLTGISIQLAAALEAAGKRKEAFVVYLQAIGEIYEQYQVYNDEEWVHPGWAALSLEDGENGKVRLRAISLANSAASLAADLHWTGAPVPSTSSITPTTTAAVERRDIAWPPSWTKSWEELELNLRTFAVTQVLHLAANTTGIPAHELPTSPLLDTRLPSWLTRMDLAAPCESLAECYVKRGEISLALPLYQTSYHFLLSPSIMSSLSSTSPLSISSSPTDPTTMCFAASILTAMSAAVIGAEMPKNVLRDKSISKKGSANSALSHRASAAEADDRPPIPAVRSWMRESRRLVDMARRIQGGRPYQEIVQGINPLGREEDPKGGESKALHGSSSLSTETMPPTTPESAVTDIDQISPEEKDRRIVRTDLKRIREMNRRRKEAEFKRATEGSSWAPWSSSSNETNKTNQQVQDPKGSFRENPICERVWAVALYNTGAVEMMDDNLSLAEDYFQFALEQSRRVNLLQGVEMSKASLQDLKQRASTSRK